MDILLLFKGMIIGITIAAPIGPIGLLCVRRTLVSGRLSGFVSGLGVATADGVYGAVAAFGITSVSNILVGQQLWVRLIGGLFLLFLGIKTLLSKPSEKATPEKKSQMLGNYFSMFLITITNPLTILYFALIFAGLGLGSSNTNYISAVLMVVGVISGSVLWWFILSRVVSHFRPIFNIKRMKIINWISGSVIIILAVIALFSSLKP
jgi:threonine/homoserine/homoserine lactone efflux protein